MTDTIRLAADFLIDASLRGSVLILLVLAIHWLTRDLIPSRWRHAMWLLVFLRLVMPAGPESPVSLFNINRFLAITTQDRPIEIAVARRDRDARPMVLAGAPEEITYRLIDTGPVRRTLGFLSLAGLLFFALRSIVTSIRFERMLRRDAAGQPGLSDGTLRLLHECRELLGVRSRVRLMETDHVATPALHGVIRPTLLMPRGFSESFTADELRFVFLHELAHLRRSDVLLNCAITAIAVMHWFNPLVWLATRRVREEREIACDEMSLACLQQEERFEYGRTILKLLELFRPPAPFPAVLGILNDKDQIKRRLTMITRFRNHPRGTVLFLALLAGMAAISLTDARAGEAQQRIRRFDMTREPELQKLDVPVNITLTGASLGELLTVLAAQSGVNITQTEEVSNSAVQGRRITVQADAVPAHAVLIETLSALKLGFEVGADGITVKEGPPVERFLMLHGKGEPGQKFHRRIINRESSDGPMKIEDEVEVELEGPASADDQKRVVMILHADEKDASAAGEGEKKRMFIHKVPQDGKVLADGTIRREIKLNVDRNGVTTSGSLVLEISPEAN